MPSDVADYFLSELAKVFNEEDNLYKLSVFFIFCFKVSPIAASSRATSQNFQTFFRLFNCQRTCNKRKERQLLSLPEKLALPLLKQNEFFIKTNSLNFYALGAETKPLPLF